MVTRFTGDMQVNRRRAEVSKEVAHEALETALATEDVVALRRSAEAGWRNEQDVDRLRARAVRVCQQIPALAPSWSGCESRRTRRSSWRWGWRR